MREGRKAAKKRKKAKFVSLSCATADPQVQSLSAHMWQKIFERAGANCSKERVSQRETEREKKKRERERREEQQAAPSSVERRQSSHCASRRISECV